MKKKLLNAILCLIGCTALQAQVKIGDNASSINTRSLLELESTTKGLLLPRMTNLQIAAMSGVPTGMLVFSSTDSALYLRRDTGWAILTLANSPAAATSKWASSGNNIYNTNSNGKVGIGTSTPYSQLSNTAANTIGSDDAGGNPGSFSWAASQEGYVGQFYNGGTATNSNGVVIKTKNTTATALDVSQGTDQGATPTSILSVKNGQVNLQNVAINNTGAAYDFLINKGSNLVGSRKGHGGLGMRWCIAVRGLFPPSDNGNTTDYTSQILGEVRLFAYGFRIPDSFVPCDGQLLTVSGYTALFALIGTTYGGNGTTNFQLPDLRGAVPVGTGTSTAGYQWPLGFKSN